MSRCVCGCVRAPHQHYRRGTDCALCPDCPRWRRRWWWRPAARVLLQIAGGIAVFAVAVTAGAWAVHGMILLIRDVP